MSNETRLYASGWPWLTLAGLSAGILALIAYDRINGLPAWILTVLSLFLFLTGLSRWLAPHRRQLLIDTEGIKECRFFETLHLRWQEIIRFETRRYCLGLREGLFIRIAADDVFSPSKRRLVQRVCGAFTLLPQRGEILCRLACTYGESAPKLAAFLNECKNRRAGEAIATPATVTFAAQRFYFNR